MTLVIASGGPHLQSVSKSLLQENRERRKLFRIGEAVQFSVREHHGRSNGVEWLASYSGIAITPADASMGLEERLEICIVNFSGVVPKQVLGLAMDLAAHT